MAEIWEAIKASPSEKALGPNGFTGIFYRRCWTIIRSDIVAAFDHLYRLAGGGFASLNRALLFLLPKKAQLTCVKDYRPISLIHSFGKLFSKVLARRLDPHMCDMVSDVQSAFIKSRSIHENFLYVRNLARTMHHRKKPCLLLKLDFAQAFDSVSWEYLLELLQRLGFPSRWRDWLSLLFTTASTSVLLNGVAGLPLRHHRGLRQGDPLSPLLFDLAIDPLHGLLLQASASGLLPPFPAREASSRISLYADDAIISAKPVRRELSSLLDIVTRFGDASGLRINISKCSVAPIRCQGIDLDTVLHGFDGQRVGFPITYLGLPLSMGRLKLAHLQYALDRARAKLATWKGKLMNAGGRRVLTRSVLDSLSIYTLTSLRLPQKFIAAFDKVRRRFTWDIEEDEVAGGKCKVSWQIVCSPMEFGGLGILHLGAFARALWLRWLWLKWHFPDRPWTKFGTPCDTLDHELFAIATRVTIGDGRTASFWWSTWLGSSTLRSRFPLLYKHSARKHHSVANALLNNHWVLDLRRAPVQLILDDFILLWRLLHSGEAPLPANQQDSIRWLLTTDGVYSAKSAYSIQMEGRQLSAIPVLVWDAWAPAKCKMFAWLLLQNRLWCADRLMMREWPNCYFCPLCIRHLETAKHLFLDCPFARIIWAAIAAWPHCSGLAPRSWSTCTSLPDAWEAMIATTAGEHREGVRSLIILVSWELWKERNNHVFKDKSSSMRRLVLLVREEAQSWVFSGALKLKRLLWEPL